MSRISCQTYKPHRYVYFCGTDAANEIQKESEKENIEWDQKMKPKNWNNEARWIDRENVSTSKWERERECKLKSDQGRHRQTQWTPHAEWGGRK